jgi:hypothetical protein
MKITVFGPNLSSKGQKLGDMHVHTAECQDAKRYGPGKPMGGEDRGWTIEANSRKDVVLEVYPPGDFEYDSQTEWLDYDDLYVAPCVKFDK